MRKITELRCLIVVLFALVGIISPAYAQQQDYFEIGGIVKDGIGEPVTGATIMVKNAQNWYYYGH